MERFVQLITNFLENRNIHAELSFYKEHHRILGKHPIFTEVARIRGLRTLSIKDLIKKAENLKEAIWRVTSEIAKKNRPHLNAKRERRLTAYSSELAEITRLIDNYG